MLLTTGTGNCYTYWIKNLQYDEFTNLNICSKGDQFKHMFKGRQLKYVRHLVYLACCLCWTNV